MSQGTILFFTAINFLNYFDRYLVSALVPVLRETMSLSYEQGGRLVSAFVFGYFLFSPIFGVLGDRYSRPKLMAFGVFLWSLATIATGWTTTFLSFLAVRIFVGVGEASFGTISPGYIKDRIPDPIRLNQVLSIFYTAIPVGAAIAYIFAGQIATMFSWQKVFLFGGIPGLLLAPFLLRCPEVSRNVEQKASVKNGLEVILATPLLVYAILGYVLNSFALNGIAAFISELGVALGYTLDEITLRFGGILVVSGFLGTIVGGQISSRLAARSSEPLRAMMGFIGLTALMAVPLLALVFFVHSPSFFLILCFLVETLVFAGTAPVNAVIVSASPKNFITFTQGITIFLLNLLGALLAPWLIGLSADYVSLQTAMQLTTIALFGCAVFWLLGTRSGVYTSLRTLESVG